MQLTYDRVLVTGGAGFIGSHTVDALVDSDIKVWVLDNLSSGSYQNLRHLKGDLRLRLTKGDIRKRKTVERLIHKVDAVVHLAAMVNPAVSLRKPEFTNEVNVLGTLNVLCAARARGLERVVFASSSSVYGQSTRDRISENHVLNPITPYGASKLAAEKYCSAFHKSFGVNTVSLRYFNVYGERQRSNPYSGVVAIFLRQLRKDRRPTIYGDGNQARDFVHVSDVAKANLLALQTKNGIGESLNIGTGHPTTIRQLHDLLAKLVGKHRLSPTFAEQRHGDIRFSCARTGRAHAVLGFEPQLSLRSGLIRLMSSQGGREFTRRGY